MTKIIRTTTRAEGGITAEEKGKMDAIVKKYIKIAFRTEPINKEKITDAIYRLYESAGLKRPRVIIVPSPLVGRLVAGIASAVWYLRKKKDAATSAATYVATDAATRAATDDAKNKKTWLWNVIQEFTPNQIAFTLGCVSSSWKLYQGGNMWAYFLTYAEAMRDIIGLSGLECWGKYQAWEDAGKEGGFRFMHEEFCIVSDFPEILSVDDQNRPHSEIGPSHRWRDGFEIYYLQGVRLDKKLYRGIINKTLSAKEALKIGNQDQRAVAMQYLGGEKILKELGGKKFSKDEYGELWRLEKKDTNGNPYVYFVDGDPSKNNQKVYLRTHPDMKTPQEAMTRAYKLQRWSISYTPNIRT